MNQTRQQLTLFVPDEQRAVIEKIRSTFNPVQYSLIPAHVTLCREDEIKKIELVVQNIQLITRSTPLTIQFNPIERFFEGKGVIMPAKENDDFIALRKSILKGLQDEPREHRAHITLMHPRNSTCTDEILVQLQAYQLPIVLDFDRISLIEQVNGQHWKVKEEFSFSK